MHTRARAHTRQTPMHIQASCDLQQKQCIQHEPWQRDPWWAILCLITSALHAPHTRARSRPFQHAPCHYNLLSGRDFQETSAGCTPAHSGLDWFGAAELRQDPGTSCWLQGSLTRQQVKGAGPEAGTCFKESTHSKGSAFPWSVVRRMTVSTHPQKRRNLLTADNS